MAKRKQARRSKGARPPLRRALLWAVLIAQTLWLGAFIWSARSPVPPALSEWVSERWQSHSADAGIRELLAEEGSVAP